MSASSRDANGDSGAHTRATLGLYRSAVQSHALFHERQPDAGSLHGAGVGRLYGCESIEDAWQVLCRDPGAGVRHLELEAILDHMRLDADLPPERELHRVGEQI